MTSSSSTNEFSDANLSPGAELVPAREKRRGSRRSRRRGASFTGRVGLIFCVGAVAVAPLMVGGVHRVPMELLMVACALSLGLMTMAATLERRPLRVGKEVVLPAILLAIPVLQSLPLPIALRGLLDPNGNSLLLENSLMARHFWPLSLDPAVTREHIGKAAAALAIFVVAYHLASGQTRRHVFPRLIAISGIAAVTIGLGHRILGFAEIYGLFPTTRSSLLTGPFVNGNHTAEFLELATFACLACAFARNTALNRYGWFTGVLLCAAGAIGTFSRGGIAALLAGLLLFACLRYVAKDGGPGMRRAVSLAWGAFAVLLLLLMAGAMGAGALIDRFRASALSEDGRFHLWRDSLQVLLAHPAGIGRGAFERLYPAYRTVKTSLPTTFAFVENQPLQLLIDAGWVLFGAIVVGVVVVVRQMVRRARGDKIEAALQAGLFAVAVHNTVDFGLETLGVLLPFTALLGTILGRGRKPEDAEAPTAAVRNLVVFTCACLVFGAASLVHPSSDDFDKAIGRARGPEQVRAVLTRAQAIHPTDYFYALGYARTEPLRSATRGRSPRLHALNRALRLCPGCEMVHMEVARSLWQLGSRGQALIEWRTAVRLRPLMFPQVMEEVWLLGAKPLELAAVASYDAEKVVEAAAFLAARSKLPEALAVLDQADGMGAPRTESLVTRARLQLQSGQLSAAQTTLAEVHVARLQDPRLAVLDAELILALKDGHGADEALGILDLAAARYPLDVAVQRMRISLVTDYKKWQAADRAIDGLKLALYHAQGSALEANLAAARIRARLSQWSVAVGEYRIALTQVRNQVWLWIEFAQAAENAGRDTIAREAYTEAARIAPSDVKITEALRRIDARQGRSRGTGGAGGYSHPF